MNIAVGILTDIIHFIRLVVFAVLDILGAVIRPVLAGLGLLGFAMCGFYALVAPKSHFPQGQMLSIDHEHVFFKADGQPIRNLQYAWIRWHRTLTSTLKGRYRDPYNARHSSVSWNLMAGKNPLLVAKQHGHGVNTMLEVYAAWIEGAKESDVEAIRRAMESGSPVPSRTTTRPDAGAAVSNPSLECPLR